MHQHQCDRRAAWVICDQKALEFYLTSWYLAVLLTNALFLAVYAADLYMGIFRTDKSAGGWICRQCTCQPVWKFQLPADLSALTVHMHRSVAKPATSCAKANGKSELMFWFWYSCLAKCESRTASEPCWPATGLTCLYLLFIKPPCVVQCFSDMWS